MFIGIGLSITGGRGGVRTPEIVLSNRTVSEAGGLVGILSVSNGEGSYTFAIDSDPDSKFSIENGNELHATDLDFETATSHSVTISATGTGDPPPRQFTINVTDVVIGAPVSIAVVEPITNPPSFDVVLRSGEGSPHDAEEGDVVQLGVASQTVDYESDPLSAGDIIAEEIEIANGVLSAVERTPHVRIKRGDELSAWVSGDPYTVLAITSSATFNIDENETAVGTVTASATSTFAITGGADAALFSIDTNTGAITFDAAPDYETPGDDDEDNVYEIIVTATRTSDSATATQDIEITVQDVAESTGWALLTGIHESAKGFDSPVTTAAINTTGADFIVAAISQFSGFADGSVSDSEGNTWSPLTVQESTIAHAKLFYCANPNVGASHTFTVSNGGAGTDIAGAIAVAAFSGGHATPFDVENGSQSSSSVTSRQPGTVTPSQDNSLIITALSTGGAITNLAINSSFAITDHEPFQNSVNEGVALAYLVQGTAAGVNPTWSWTTAIQTSAVIAVFKPA